MVQPAIMQVGWLCPPSFSLNPPGYTLPTFHASGTHTNKQPRSSNRPRPQVRLLTGPDGAPLAASVEDTQLIVTLWRSNAVAGVVELNGRTLAVSRADDVAGLMFGAGAKALLRRDFRE
jgi:hypothetical protein